MIKRLAKWWGHFVAANERNGLRNTPFVYYDPAKPVRTAGAPGLRFHTSLETPLYDPSGPTVPNARPLLFLEGAIYPAPDPNYVGADIVQGVPNQDSLDLSGLLQPLNPDNTASAGE